MLKRKLGLLAAAAVMVGMFTSCVNVIKNDKGNEGSGDQTSNTQEPEIDYTNYTGSDYSIKVKNETNQNVVCFKGAPSAAADNLISGALSHQTTGLKKKANLFQETGDFVLYVFKEEDYKAKKNNPEELKKVPFALIYAFYNADSSSNDNLEYVISSSTGGQAYILINNPTAYNVEMRQGGLYGSSLAFAGANTVQTKINVAYDDYYIYPVFRKYQKKTGEIVTCFPKNAQNKNVFLSFNLSEKGQQSAEFNVESWFDANAFKDSTTPGAAYLVIKNNNAGSGISLYKGGLSEATVTSTGGKLINTGYSLTFEIPMVPTGENAFASTEVIENWQVGTAVHKTSIPKITVDAGKMYFLDVSGADAYDIQPVWRTGDDNGYKTEVVNWEDM